MQFIKKGCFNDLQSPKPLPKLMFTDLNARDTKFSGVPIDWGSWASYLQNVVCRCAQVSKAKGFYHFGIENFGRVKSKQAFFYVAVVTLVFIKGESSTLISRKKIPDRSLIVDGAN